MSIHLQRDLERLNQQLLALGALVESATSNAISALVSRRPALAEEVIEGDRAIDLREVEVEEECLKILALHQPLASDLRFIVVALKMNNDLERMGDLAVNIAERALYIATHDPIEVNLDFSSMGEVVRGMLRDALDTVIRRDVELARRVCKLDDVVDDKNREMFEVLEKVMVERPELTIRAVHLLSASRHLERIADHATNIAEDVIFMVEGDVVRHQQEHF